MPAICIHVRGDHPLPYGNNEWGWRARIGEAAREALQHYPQPLVTRQTLFALCIEFFFFRGRGDLDNLAKPVLDTIFLPNYPQVPDMNLTGVVFNVDDASVRELFLRKVPVESSEEEGADILVKWN